MTSYNVQYVLPVDNPVNKVGMGSRNGNLFFEVPINYPDAHSLSLTQLIDAAERSGIILLSTNHNKKRSLKKKSINMLDVGVAS
jgi:hypothetical protein